MKTIILIFITLTIVSCKGQESFSKNNMKKFNIESFNRNKNQFNKHSDTLANGTFIERREKKQAYYEVIRLKGDYFQEINWYYKNGNLKSHGFNFHPNFKKGIWKEYDEQGHLIKEIDYDKGFNYTWEDLLKFLKEREIKIIDRNTTIRKDEGRWHVWYVDGLYVYNIFIDGKTGEILQDVKNEFEEGS